MKCLKNIFCIIAAVILFGLFSSPMVNAEEDLAELAEESGINDVVDEIPSDAALFLEENGISPSDPDAVQKLTPDIILKYMWDKVCADAEEPLKLTGMMLAVIIIAAAGGSAADAVNKECDKIYGMVTVFAAVAVSVPGLEKCIENALDTLIKGSEFMLCYVPVFSGIAAAAGNVTSAASYNITLLFISQAASAVASEVLLPVLSVCMGMNVAQAINPGFSFSSVTGLLKKALTFITGFIMTVFTGLLSLQSIAGASADTLGVKAAKFVVSNFVPIVGGAVADAYTTMRSGLGMLRGTVGFFGAAAIALTLLPPLIEAAFFYFVLSIGEAVSAMFGVKSLESFYKGSSSVIALVIAVLSSFAVMFIISTLILMAAGLNVVSA